MTLPITVIGGYLGAGKTTLINQVLAQNPVQRLAILVNDFGSVNVDERLIAEHAGPTLQLTNGCVCCALADDLGAALKQLSPFALDHVLLEASGAALPQKVAAIGNTWPGFRHHQTVVLADAHRLHKQLDDLYIGDLVRNQLTHADLRLATKLDLCANPDAALRAIAQQFGPTTALADGRVDLDWLLQSTQPSTQSSTSAPSSSAEHQPKHSFTTRVFEHDHSLPYESVSDALHDALPHVERAKGWVETDRGRFLVQLAGGRLVFTPTEPAPNPLTSIVLISVDDGAVRAEAALRRLAGSARLTPAT